MTIVKDPECQDPDAHGHDWPIMAFECARCHRNVCGWCEGAADDRPDLCDICWVETEKLAAQELAKDEVTEIQDSDIVTKWEIILP